MIGPQSQHGAKPLPPMGRRLQVRGLAAEAHPIVFIESQRTIEVGYRRGVSGGKARNVNKIIAQLHPGQQFAIDARADVPVMHGPDRAADRQSDVQWIPSVFPYWPNPHADAN